MLKVLYTLATIARLADDVQLSPTAEGAPGGDAMQTLLDWLGQYALWAAAGAVLAGGALFGWGRMMGGGRMAAVTGTALVGGGVVGALFVGLGADLVNTFHGLGGGG